MDINVEDFLDIESPLNRVEFVGACCREPLIRHLEDKDLWFGCTWIAIPRKPSSRLLDIIQLTVYKKELAELMATQCGYKALVRARGHLGSNYFDPKYPVNEQSHVPAIVCLELEVLSPVPANPISPRPRPTGGQQHREPNAASAQSQPGEQADPGSTVTIAGRTFKVFNP